MTSSLKPLMGIWPNSAGMIPGWSPTKIIKMVLIGCISRSRGWKLGFQNAIFKNILVWNYKAQSFHIWCITSSRGPLPIFGGQHQWSSVNGSTMTFDLFLRWATQGPLGPLVLKNEALKSYLTFVPQWYVLSLVPFKQKHPDVSWYFSAAYNNKSNTL